MFFFLWTLIVLINDLLIILLVDIKMHEQSTNTGVKAQSSTLLFFSTPSNNMYLVLEKEICLNFLLTDSPHSK